ncbi:DUF433 domain-containing protein [Halomarina pelagica]|uniref:DUF433 domain-containing protein n=1 Tax=Halomarina pelagica TaxID=2961599 RepID=UPI0034A13DC2
MGAEATARVVKTPDVLHGKPRIEGTRIGVFAIGESIRRSGQTGEGVLDGYPDLSHEQVIAALEYYDEHSEAMDILRTQREANRRRVERQPRAPVDADR